MSGRTPGPWAYEQADSCCLKGPIDFFIRIYAEDPGPENDFNIGLVRDADEPTRKANARLVAAAPELLEALKEAQAWINQGTGSTPHERGAKCETLGDVFEMIESAKDKAEGRK